MGIPTNYSSDLPQRLAFLIRSLSPIVDGRLAGDDKFGGALNTTLLLALATPLIVLPTERILKPIKGKTVVANETAQLPQLTGKVDSELAANKPVSAINFLASRNWGYLGGVSRFDIVSPWPGKVLADLALPAAARAAQSLPVSQFLTDLRNALSHGGVTFLNAAGQHVYGEPAAMLAFAAHQTMAGTHFNIIRISETEFREFLLDWAAWLTN